MRVEAARIHPISSSYPNRQGTTVMSPDPIGFGMPASFSSKSPLIHEFSARSLWERPA